MARPLKQGLDYHPLDVEFYREIKVRQLNHAFGPISTVILLTLLGAVYKDRGYYAEWNDDLCFLVAVDSFSTEEVVRSVVKKALAVGLFDQNCFSTYGILTSKEIQRHYLAATYKRKGVNMVAEYFLVPEAARSNLQLTHLAKVEKKATETLPSEKAGTPVGNPISGMEISPCSQYSQYSSEGNDQGTALVLDTSVVVDEMGNQRTPVLAGKEVAADFCDSELASLATTMPPEPEADLGKGDAVGLTIPASAETVATVPATKQTSGEAGVTVPATKQKQRDLSHACPQLATTASYQAWCALWRVPNALVQREISRLVTDFGDEVVAQAVQIAGEKQVQSSRALSFVRSCLKEWRQAGVSDLASIAAYQAQRSQRFSHQSIGFAKGATYKSSGRNKSAAKGDSSDWTQLETPPVDRKTWLRLQKECYLFMGEGYEVDTSYTATPAELAWIYQEDADYENPVYTEANQGETIGKT
ncbi:DUF4373 domain-containing protein [Enterococcus asini]|uniref:DUF4373 domain-containing protein n=1 Tax=Enterococcus asini TaxID=57732 RepID=UPI0022E7CA10|nr:DUF4373 domain-containing protein [Enterococcus asini]